MKVPERQSNTVHTSHPYVTASLIIFGFGVLAIAAFWIRKCKSSSVPRHEYSALRLESNNERSNHDRQLTDGKFANWQRLIENSDRYELKNELNTIGSRINKHWFVVRDKSLDAERLLSLTQLPSTCCPIKPSNHTRDTLLKLFRALQHPYIHPILDVEFLDAGAALISPLNHCGSLKDLIYGTKWCDDYERKYRIRGRGLHIREIQCLGRQILEALLFLKRKNYPQFYHLHSGNVIIQNGVARLAGLENTLFGLCINPPYAIETIAFGYLLYEMTLGYELIEMSNNIDRLRNEFERYPMISDVLTLIFDSDHVGVGGDGPTIEELLLSDLFRRVELRELRGTQLSSHNNMLTHDVQEMLDVCKNLLETTTERNDTIVTIEPIIRQLEDIQEEEETCS